MGLEVEDYPSPNLRLQEAPLYKFEASRMDRLTKSVNSDQTRPKIGKIVEN